MQQPTEPSQPKPSPASRPCERCGAAEAGPVGDWWLCLDCYSTSGACCHEACE